MYSQVPPEASLQIICLPGFVHDIDKLSKPDFAAEEQHKQGAGVPLRGRNDSQAFLTHRDYHAFTPQWACDGKNTEEHRELLGEDVRQRGPAEY